MIRLLAGWLVFAVVGAAHAGDTLVVGKEDCKRLLGHQPAPDVAFQPGIDVRGRKVAPADLPPASPLALPKEIAIDIGVDLAEKYGTGVKDDGTQRYSAATQTLGVVKIDTLSGRVTWNGKPLDGADIEAIRKACRQKYGLR